MRRLSTTEDAKDTEKEDKPLRLRVSEKTAYSERSTLRREAAPANRQDRGQATPFVSSEEPETIAITLDFPEKELVLTWQSTFNNSRIVRAVVSLMLAGALVAPAAAQKAAKPKPQEIYRTRCEQCHGAPDNPDSAEPRMSFADGDWIHGSDVKTITKIITDGLPGTGMNGFKDQLTPQEIQALVRYIRSLDKKLKK